MAKSKVILLDWWNSDRDIAESAWVSTKKANNICAQCDGAGVIPNEFRSASNCPSCKGKGYIERPDEDVTRLIQESIVPLHHDTPKECVWLKFYIQCPIFVERQLDKYRMTTQYQDLQASEMERETEISKIETNDPNVTARGIIYTEVIKEVGAFGRWGITQNELSLRYRTMPNDYIELPGDVCEVLDRINEGIIMDDNTLISLRDEYKKVNDYAKKVYDQVCLSMRIAVDARRMTYSEMKRIREVYRGILGTSFMTDMQLILNLNAFEHIANQRLNSHAQPETQHVVSMMLDEIEKAEVAPVTVQKMIEVNTWERIGAGFNDDDNI